MAHHPGAATAGDAPQAEIDRLRAALADRDKQLAQRDAELADIRAARKDVIAYLSGQLVLSPGDAVTADVHQFGGSTWWFARDDDAQPVCPQRAAEQARNLTQEALHHDRLPSHPDGIRLPV